MIKIRHTKNTPDYKPLLPFIKIIISENRQEIEKQYAISKIGIFGSVSRQEETINSDIDILIDFYPGQAKYRRFIDLAEMLEDKLHRPVDLITVKSISPYMRQAIEQEVVWIYE